MLLELAAPKFTPGILFRPHDRIGLSDQVYQTRREYARLVNYFRSSNSVVGPRKNSAPSKFAIYLVTYSRVNELINEWNFGDVEGHRYVLGMIDTKKVYTE